MSDLVCKDCGATFPRRTEGGGMQFTRCPECRAPKTYNHVCVICEQQFTSSRKKQLTCSPECYTAYDKAKTYQWRKENPEEYRALCRKHNHTYHEKKKQSA